MYGIRQYNKTNTCDNINDDGSKCEEKLIPSSMTIGDLFQELTCIWRSTISIIPVKDLNKILDNYNSPIDHTLDSELGILQTKGRTININNVWVFDTRTEFYKKFDHTICYCADRYMKIIERIYIFPKDVMYNTSIGITKYDSLGRLYKNGWYERYRITDEEILKNVNEIFTKIITERDN